MPLYITEYAYAAKDVNGAQSSIRREPGINHTAYAITTAARNSVTFNRGTRLARIVANTAVVFAVGAAPDVSASNGALLPANVESIFGVDPAISPLINFKMFV